MSYVYSGSVHARDHGPGCSLTGVQNRPRGPGRERVLLYAHSEM